MLVTALAGEAKTSLRTLYCYGGKQGCFLACLQMTRAQTHATAQAAFEPLMPDWPRALHAAIRAEQTAQVTAEKTAARGPFDLQPAPPSHPTQAGRGRGALAARR